MPAAPATSPASGHTRARCSSVGRGAMWPSWRSGLQRSGRQVWRSG